MSPAARLPLATWLQLLHLALLAAPAVGVNCPNSCKCAWTLDSLEVNCANSGLIEYPDLADIPVEHLDLSGNYLIDFPKHYAEIESLIYLDLSNNQIQYVQADALLGFNSLRTLLLDNNTINGWASITPNEAFRPASSLKHLSLSGNQLLHLSDHMPVEVLVSESLVKLELRDTLITLVDGDMLINGMPNLEHLVLSDNPLRTIDSMPSRSLRVLELKNCKMQEISTSLLESIPNLEALSLARNTAIQLGTKYIEPLVSHTLNELDLSFCNLDEVDLSGLPALTKLLLRGNLLRQLSPEIFTNNTLLEVLDLSRNSLRLIEPEAFARLKRLTKLDLSYNEIARLDRNLFRANDLLVELNLSRNVFERFSKLVSNSLRDINLSWCEIISIDGTALSGLSSIQNLDLSYNLLHEFPAGMRSETLQRLDLSYCRLSTIRNNTLRDFPELASLRLSGNRFTNPFRVEYFKSNKYLDQIWLGDNPWICHCTDPAFLDFYNYLTEKPPKLKDKPNVRCTSPAHHYGRQWDAACSKEWQPSSNSANAAEVFSTIMICLLVLGSCCCLLTCCHKHYASYKERRDRDEYLENADEMQAIRRHNQRILEQEGRPNAPSASTLENTLPSYEDALRMPKLERPIKSMLDLTASGRERKKLVRSRTDPEGDAEDGGLLLDDRQRFRSEEMLSNRDKERTAQIGPNRRTGYVGYNNSSSRLIHVDESRFPAGIIKSQNLQSAERLTSFQSYENSPYSKRKPKIAEIPPFKRATFRSDSVEFLTDPEYDVNSKPGSPFAPRKPRPSPIDEHPPHAATIYANIQPKDLAILAPAIEDYFGRSQASEASSLADSEFQLIMQPTEGSDPSDHRGSEASAGEDPQERGRRKKRRNSTSRRASGSFNAAAAAAAAEESSSCPSDKELEVVVVADTHKPVRQTLF